MDVPNPMCILESDGLVYGNGNVSARVKLLQPPLSMRVWPGLVEQKQGRTRRLRQRAPT